MCKRRCNTNQYHEYVKQTVKKKLNISGGITRNRRVNDRKYNDEKQKRQNKTKNTLVDKTVLESYKLSNADAAKNQR
jgi:hypothetical protein